MSRYIDAERIRIRYGLKFDGSFNGLMGVAFKEDIDKVPTADVRENVRGYWKKRKDKPLQNWYQCSNCGAICGETPKYCSECGADMRGEA